ncbi:MAG: hypothetical protein NTX49_00395 [Chlamydiae bacterium]|nr:hypothetical protein [Chlamydiota bacterium]
MLLQFSVKNFRSFEKEETLDLSAGKGSELFESNTFEFAQNERLVRSAVIYGYSIALAPCFYDYPRFDSTNIRW